VSEQAGTVTGSRLTDAGLVGPLTDRYVPGLPASFLGPSTTMRQMRSFTHAASLPVSRAARALSSGRTSWI
jgi:hypothetical protein